MGCFGSKEEGVHNPNTTSDGQPSLARNDGGIIGRHGHLGAAMVGFGAGNYGGGYGGSDVGGAWGPSGWGAESRVKVKQDAKDGGAGKTA